MTTDPKSIRPARGLWAAVSPAKRGGYHIAPTTIRHTKKEVREECAGWFSGGWPYLRKEGWRIIRVDVIPSEEGNDGK